MKGKLVILEGVESVGKSTLIEQLKKETPDELRKYAVFVHEQGRQELPFAHREPAYWFHRLQLYADVARLFHKGMFIIAERSWLSGWCYEPRLYQPMLMSIIYRGIGIAPEDVYVVVVQPEECPVHDDRTRLAYERYNELIEYGSPLGEQVMGGRTTESAKNFILHLLQQHADAMRGKDDETETVANAPVSG